MHRNIVGLSIILLSSSINFVGQLFFRKLSIKILNSGVDQDVKVPTYLLFIRGMFPPSRELIAGALLLFIGLNIWVVALGFIRFSIAFPIYLSLSIAFSVLYSTAISKESLGGFQYLGLGLLVLAIMLLVRK